MNNPLPLAAIRPATIGDLLAVEHYQRKHAYELGFLPSAALVERIDMGHVIVAEENDDPAGYLLGQPGATPANHHVSRIYHACIDYSLRKRHLGFALVESWVRSSPTAKLLQLWCLEYLESNDFWRLAGFTPVAIRSGGKKGQRGSSLQRHICWRRALQPGVDVHLWPLNPRGPHGAYDQFWRIPRTMAHAPLDQLRKLTEATKLHFLPMPHAKPDLTPTLYPSLLPNSTSGGPERGSSQPANLRAPPLVAHVPPLRLHLPSE